MRVPYSWLRAYCDPGIEPRALAERLAMTGTEVERVGVVGPASAGGFVVGRVLRREKHPDADRLSVCAVDVGEAEPSTIVCGAPNVEAGQTVAVARPGAVMPDGTKLRRAKLRGVESHGMILSAAELEVAEDSDGIMVLDRDYPDAVRSIGDRFEDVIGLPDVWFDLAITPNRPDCLSVYGLARDLASYFRLPLGDRGEMHSAGDATRQRQPAQRRTGVAHPARQRARNRRRVSARR